MPSKQTTESKPVGFNAAAIAAIGLAFVLETDVTDIKAVVQLTAVFANRFIDNVVCL